MNKYIRGIILVVRDVILVISGVLVIVGLFFIVILIYINKHDGFLAKAPGQSGVRIYSKTGIILARKDDPNKEYNVINFTLVVPIEAYHNLVFFHTPEEADAAGYKPSEHFARDYKCLKQGKAFIHCSPPKNSEEKGMVS